MPKTPDTLSPQAAAVWQRITADLPGGFVTPATEPLLIAYCRHVCTAEDIATLIAQQRSAAELDIEQLNKLFVMQARETKEIGGCLERIHGLAAKTKRAALFG